jgi:excisionase family DNA binding protein
MPGVTYLTVDDVAAILKVSKRTVWRWSATGQMPAAHKLAGTTYRWVQADIEEWQRKLAREAAPVRLALPA